VGPGASSVFASWVRSVDEGPPDWRYGAGQSFSLIGALEIKEKHGGQACIRSCMLC
jgi:hypothetical protein